MTRVVLTQPWPRVDTLAESLRARGHEVLALPTRRLEPLVEQPAVRVILDTIWTFDWVVFVSPGSVDAAWPALAKGWPPGTGIATVGPGTESALLAHGVDDRTGAGLVRPRQAPYDAAALMREPPFDAPAGLRVLVIRGSTGRDDWIERLRAAGAQVDVLAVHRSDSLPLAASSMQALRQWLAEAANRPLAIVFTSADAIDTVSAAIEPMDRLSAWALTVHPRLAQALHKCGWMRVLEIEPGETGLQAGIESLVPR